MQIQRGFEAPAPAAPVEIQLKMADNKGDTTINALSTLLESKGLDAGDLISAINTLATIKKREIEKQDKEEEKAKSKEKKIFVDKEFIFPTRTDCFIYKDGRTKSGRYYIRIYDEKTKRVFSQSLRTTNRMEAWVAAERLYRENKDRLLRGVQLNSINTKQLINLYLQERAKEITTIPHEGITQTSYDGLIKKLKYWEQYIEAKKMSKKNIEDIPVDIGKGFGTWMMEQPKQFYKNRDDRSKETINHHIAAIKKMYKDIAIEEKFITMAEFPQFKYLKVNREQKHKRDILEPAELSELRHWMRDKWCREPDISDLERVKRRVFSLYLVIQYMTGCRSKEMLGIRWGDIKTIQTDSKELQKVNRAIHIPASNSKTGRSRDCVAPVRYEFERIANHYRKLGIEMNRDDFVFINLAKTKRGTNTTLTQKAMNDRLQAVLEGSGVQKKLQASGRALTPYSARHYAVSDAIMRGVSIYDIAVNVGTSVFYIERTYSHITALMKSKELTKGQGIHQVLEERSKLTDNEETMVEN